MTDRKQVRLLDKQSLPDDDRATSTSSSILKKRKAVTSTVETDASASRAALVTAQVKDDMYSKFEVTAEILASIVLFNINWKTKNQNATLADATIAMARTHESDRNKHLH